MEHVNAEILRAIADGEKVQYRDVAKGVDWVQNGPWKDFDVKSIEACFNLLAGQLVIGIEWRIAPKTIMIGEHEVPEPCREALRLGQKFWAVNPFTGLQHFTWECSKEDFHALKSGFVHLTEKAARQHYEAFKSLLVK